MDYTILELAKKLISIPSTKSDFEGLNQVLEECQKNLIGFNVKKFKKNNNTSLLYFNEKTLPEKFKVILNAHLDVVPASKNQYIPKLKNNQLHGRGAVDMKSAAAVEIFVFKDLANQLNYPLGLQLVTDEETGGFNGTKYQLDLGIRSDFVIAGEHTDFGINSKAKGVLWLKVIAHGKTGHAAYPWQSKNAIVEMNTFLTNLINVFPIPKKEAWQTTVNVAKIETENQTINKVPDSCTALLDIRFIPEDSKTVIQTIKKILPKNFDLEIIEKESEHVVDEKSPFVLALKKSIKKVTGKNAELIVKHGASDVRHYTSVGNSGVTFGPIGFGLHAGEEWVDVKSLSDYYQILKDFLLSLS